MKKFLALFLAALLLAPAALADIPDISGLTFDELVALREQINLALWNSAEWQEVTVPEGVWVVGEDIPAGHWTIRVASSHDILNVCYMDKVDTITGDPLYGAKLFIRTIASPGFSGFGEINAEYADIEMEDGWFFKCTGAVIFTPYTGKPDLGFK